MSVCDQVWITVPDQSSPLLADLGSQRKAYLRISCPPNSERDESCLHHLLSAPVGELIGYPFELLLRWQSDL